MSMFGTLTAPKAVKFEQIRAGSVVEVHDRRSPDDSMTATVLESKAEFGPTGVPALLLKPHPQPGVEMEDTMLVFSNGNWVVTVMTDSASLYQEPDDLLTIVPKRVERTALRFVGGTGAAETIIRWASGHAVISYHPAESQHPEHLSVHTLEGVHDAYVGSYVVSDGKHFEVIAPEVFTEQYDVAGEE